MQLTEKDKQYLKSNGYEEDDFGQIEEAMNKAIFAVFFNDNFAKCKIVDYEKARDFLGNETLLSGIARSAFHFSASREIPHTFGKYSIGIDSGEMLGGKKSVFFERNSEDFDMDVVEKLVDNPCIRVSGIKWDITDEDYEGEYGDNLELPDEIVVTLDNFPAIVHDLDDISDYISDITGFCHYGGYEIECNYSIEELYEMIKEIDKELEAEYKDGETVWASNLECMREEVEAMICLMEEYERENNIEKE